MLVAKPDERARWEGYCRRLGLPPPIIFSPETGKFDFISYELGQPGGSVESVAQLLDMLVQVGSRASGKGDEPFWALYASKIFRRAIAACYYGTGRCTIEDLYLFITGAPQSLAQTKDPEWQKDSEVWKVLSSQRAANHPDFALARLFWLGEFPTTSEKTRSVGVAMATNVLDKFLTWPISRVVSGGTTISPEEVLAGRVVILDMPVLLWREVGQFFQIIFKTCLQRAALRRVDPDISACIWADECQFFMTEADQLAQTVARQARLINVCLTQTMPGLTAAMGGDKKQAEVNAWTALFQTKIFAQSSCPSTNVYASKLIGDSLQQMYSGGQGENFDPVADWMGQPQFKMSWQEQWMPQVRPEEFTRLVKGGRGVVETICYLGGDKSWRRLMFRQ